MDILRQRAGKRLPVHGCEDLTQFVTRMTKVCPRGMKWSVPELICLPLAHEILDMAAIRRGPDGAKVRIEPRTRPGQRSKMIEDFPETVHMLERIGGEKQITRSFVRRKIKNRDTMTDYLSRVATISEVARIHGVPDPDVRVCYQAGRQSTADFHHNCIAQVEQLPETIKRGNLIVRQLTNQRQRPY